MPGLTRSRRLPALVLAAGLLAPLPGCGARTQEAATRIFAMDTVMSLTIYGEKDGPKEALEEATAAVYQLQDQLSATDEDSEISLLDRAEGAWADLSPGTALLLSDALDLCELTDGALDLTAYPAVKAWGFTTGEYRVPGAKELEELVSRIDYSAVELDVENHRARLPQGMELDLGAVAKGYAADKLVQIMEGRGVTSALLDLGQSTIQAVGGKPDGAPWRIGIQDPAGDGYLGVLELKDQGMGTSGGYQRYFEQGGMRYWHIIDPETAAPARSGLASVTVVSPSGLVCDGLSTALFVMGLEKGVQFWRDHPELDFEVLFVSDDGSLTVTPGLEKVFSLAQQNQDRGVTVLP